MKLKASGKECLFNGGKWGFHSLKIQYFKSVDGVREINLTQPRSRIKYLFIHRMLSKGNFGLFRK